MSLLAAAGDIPNASMPLPWLIVSGQPSGAQFTALAAAGIQNVIDLRDEMEPRPLDEPTTVDKLGMHYHNLPVVFGALSDETMDGILAALRQSRDVPTLLHCNSANRTGGPLIAYLVLDEHREQQSAIDTAMQSGLRSAEVLQWAIDYVNRSH